MRLREVVADHTQLRTEQSSEIQDLKLQLLTATIDAMILRNWLDKLVMSTGVPNLASARSLRKGMAALAKRSGNTWRRRALLRYA
jgi:hypothetical protein